MTTTTPFPRPPFFSDANVYTYGGDQTKKSERAKERERCAFENSQDWEHAYACSSKNGAPALAHQKTKIFYEDAPIAANSPPPLRNIFFPKRQYFYSLGRFF